MAVCGRPYSVPLLTRQLLICYLLYVYVDTKNSLSSECRRLGELCQGESVKLVVLFSALTARDHSLVSILFSFPFLLPIPLPGLSTIFGMIIIMMGIAVALDKKPWLPKRWHHKEIPTATLQKTFMAAEKFFLKFEKIFKPRGAWFIKHPGVKRFNGVLLSMCGLLLALPMLPGGNFPPAIAIILLSIATLEEDSVVLGLSYIAFLLNLLFFVFLFMMGKVGLSSIL